MSRLKEKNYPLEEVVRKFQQQEIDITSVEDLLEIESKGDIALFESQEECFWWINDSESSIETTLHDLLYLSSEELNSYANVLDYKMNQQNIVTLDDGRVVFTYM